MFMVIEYIVTICYLVFAIWEILRLQRPERGYRRKLRWALLGVACIHFILLIFQFTSPGYADTHRGPLWLSFTALALAALYLVAALRFDMAFLGAFIMPVAVALMVLGQAPGVGGMNGTPSEVNPWIFIHAGLILIGYAAFLTACVVAILYLVQENRLKKGNIRRVFRWLPPLDSLDMGNYHLIRLGFATLTLAIMTGLVPAIARNGLKALTDLTVLLTLLTWILYAVLFQLRLTSTLRGRKVAIFSILLVVGVIFSWMGASFIGGGIHGPRKITEGDAPRAEASHQPGSPIPSSDGEGRTLN